MHGYLYITYLFKTSKLSQKEWERPFFKNIFSQFLNTFSQLWFAFFSISITSISKKIDHSFSNLIYFPTSKKSKNVKKTKKMDFSWKFAVFFKKRIWLDQRLATEDIDPSLRQYKTHESSSLKLSRMDRNGHCYFCLNVQFS